ncbi:DUF418 domain-containing protein [Corynebacterium aquatimens]|uniref:Membrane protein YeiB n=1 Tax=Corynebacterium aquatimens TaxID=1190508 RepID=A0A931DWE0_9CORY|nr:DUF418 domain-containing protein [Corynebacterium aquatimens]MBG6121325.1 putative membrane protein YeiB [Corynebacterium aquatimens]
MPESFTTTRPVEKVSTPSPRVRVTGVDIARAVALIGMMFAHLTLPAGIAGMLLDGFPSAGFAFLAGVSMSLMARRAVASGGRALAVQRHQFAVRGAMLMLFDALLVPFAGDIAVVLLPFGICYIALAPVVRWRTKNLVWLAVALTVLSACASLIFSSWSMAFQTPENTSATPHGGILDGIAYFLPDVLAPPYPLLEWAALMVMGMIAWRVILAPLASRTTATGTTATGATTAAAATTTAPSPQVDVRPRAAAVIAGGLILAAFAMVGRHYLNPESPGYGLYDPNGHTGGLIAVLGEAGMAVAVATFCVWIASTRIATHSIGDRLLMPLYRMGRMPLTIYVLHVITANFGHGTAFAIVSALAAIALATAWFTFFNRGPLEALLHRTCSAASREDLPGRRNIAPQLAA